MCVLICVWFCYSMRTLYIYVYVYICAYVLCCALYVKVPVIFSVYVVCGPAWKEMCQFDCTFA